MIDFYVKNRIIDLTTNKVKAEIDNIYRETMRELLNQFGDIYYIDGNNNKIQIKCVPGTQERVIGKLKKDNTLILPYITVTENGTSNSEQRRKYNPLLISEVEWNDKTRRATRVLSLSPRPVDLVYSINIWTKYKSDMDMIRSTIFSMFNPDLNIRTKYSDFNKSFIEDESDLGETKAQDTDDRTLQKSISIVVETYIPSPKFFFTNTGEIHEYFQDYQIFDLNEDIYTGTPIEQEIIQNNLT